jgi:hypothetical protein
VRIGKREDKQGWNTVFGIVGFLRLDLISGIRVVVKKTTKGRNCYRSVVKKTARLEKNTEAKATAD